MLHTKQYCQRREQCTHVHITHQLSLSTQTFKSFRLIRYPSSKTMFLRHV
jgi:hypothetical protein